MKSPLLSRILACCALIAVACESDDGLNVTNTEQASKSVRLVTSIDKSTLIDLTTMTRNIKGVDLSGSGITYPDYYNQRYLRYKDCASNPTEFSFGVLHHNNSKTEVNVTLLRQDASGLGFRRASMTNKEILVVNLLNNPEFAHYDPFSKSEISVMTNKPGDVNYNNSSVMIDVSSCGQRLGNAAILTYSPPAGFVGQVRFKYYLSIKVDSKGAAVCYSPDGADFSSEHEVVIDVSN